MRLSWWLDLKLGFRLLIKRPGLALAGGAGIAIAVAISAAAFSLIHGNFLALSLPLPDGGRLVSLELWDSSTAKPELRTLYDFHLWRDGLQSIQELSAFRDITPNLIEPGAQPESVRVGAVSASAFRLARVSPLLGRYLLDADEREGAPPVVVIAESVWRHRFAADPAILGRLLQFGSTRHTVVGVMPEGFGFPVNHRFWVPLRLGLPPSEPLTGPGLRVFGRLAPQATLATAQAELTAAGQRTALAFPKSYVSLRPLIMPYAYPFLGLHGTKDWVGLVALQGLFISLLVLVCLNVAILVYTRTATRQAEIALRTALGASRSRIVAQLFFEALALSAVAALGGLSLAALALRQIAAAVSPLALELPFWMTFQLSPESILYTAGLSVLAAAIVGILPALQATRRDLQPGFRMGASGALRLGTTWTLLIVAQVGFAVAFLPPAVSAAWRDAQNSLAGPGFAAGEFLVAQLGTDAGASAFAARQTELIHRLKADARVSDVTFAMVLPGDERGVRIEIDGPEIQNHEARSNRVDPDFFRVFDVPVLAGRSFQPGDLSVSEGGPILVNLPLAQRIFGGNALGRRIRYPSGPWHEIAGVVADFPKGVSPGMRDTSLKIYHPAAPGQVLPAALAIRLPGLDPVSFTQSLRKISAAVDPDLHLRDIRGMEEALRREQWISRLETAFFAAVTLSVLIVSSAGIYSLMSFTVSQRRKEIGIRMALGAGRQSILAGIFSRALAQLTAGVVLGAAFGASLDRASGGELMQGTGAIVIPAVIVALMAVGFLAALGPARRSLRIAPLDALREE